MEYVYVAVVIIVLARLISKRASSKAATSDAIACPTCGYDLRATLERCPECGTPIPTFRRPLDPKKLRDDWPLTPIEPRRPGDEEMLVRIWDAPNRFAATLLIEQFRARGIQATVQKRLEPMQVGTYVAPPADFTVNVWSGDIELAEIALGRLRIQPLPELERRGEKAESAKGTS